MLKPSTKKSGITDEALQVSPPSEPPRYIFSEETFQTLLAIGEVLRRAHNRLETEKAAAIGVKRPNNVSMEK